MGFKNALSKCCCQICSDCCNGVPTEFDVTITLDDSSCDYCDIIGGTFTLGPLNAICAASYISNATINCSTISYVERQVYYREVRLVIRCVEPYWIVNVYMTIYQRKFDPSFGVSYIRNDFWWRKQIDATGIECADICDDLELIQKTNYGTEWICDPGALSSTTHCNVCAVP